MLDWSGKRFPDTRGAHHAACLPPRTGSPRQPEIARRGLAPHTFGNASGIDRSGAQPLVVIKPSGVDYATLTPGRPGRHRSRRQDCRRHAAPLERSRHPYPALPRVSADRRRRPHALRVRHVLGAGLPPDSLPRHHPRRLLSRAGAGHGPSDRDRGVGSLCAQHRGRHRAAASAAENLDPVAVPGVLVAGHAPFAWGKSPIDAVEHADVLEYIARLAFRSVLLGRPGIGPSGVRERASLPAQARTEGDVRPEMRNPADRI